MALWAIRMGLMVAGSWASSKGYASQDDVELIAGGVTAAAGAVWSARERYKAIKR